MITSQYIMILAFGCIAITWLFSWVVGNRAATVQRRFAALTVQAFAAVLLSFSSGSLLLSLSLAVIILATVVWMIQSAAPSQKNQADG